MDFFIHLPTPPKDMWVWLLAWAKKEAPSSTYHFIERFQLTDEDGGFDVALIGSILQTWLTPEKNAEIPHFHERLMEYEKKGENNEHLVGILKRLHSGEFGLEDVSCAPVFNSTAIADDSSSLNQSTFHQTSKSRRLSLSDTLTSLSNSFNDSPMASKKRKLMNTQVNIIFTTIKQ